MTTTMNRSTPTITSVFGSKGGTGKTSVIGNLSACLADMGQRVLMIDADIQQSLTNFFHIDQLAEKGLVQLIQEQNPDGCISRTDIEGLDIVVSNDFEKSLGHWIRFSSSRMQALRVALARLPEGAYDYVMIDTQGADGTGDLQELVVNASDRILLPVQPDALVTREFATNSLQILDRYQPLDPDDTRHRVPRPHVLIYRYDRSRSHAVYLEGLRAMIAQLAADGRVIPVGTEIPHVVAYNAAQSGEEKKPVHRYDSRRRKDATLPCAYESMTALAHELFPELVPLEPRVGDDAPFPVRPAPAGAREEVNA